MKACIHSKYGPPELLHMEELEIPSCNEDEILVEVKATTVNRTDCAMLRAKPFIMRFLTGLTKPSNPILGTDFAGEIKEIGNRVLDYKVGDCIFGFDDNGLSSHAQYLKISPSKPIDKIPEGISFEQAVASIEGTHYAINIFNKFRFSSGQHVLINGASGAIGNASLQLARFYGLKITTVCNAKNLELMKSQGAGQVINYEQDDFTQSGVSCDFIIDAVGKSTFGRCKPILKDRGIYISSELGPNGQNLFYALCTPLLGGKNVIFPVPSDKKSSVKMVRKLLKEGEFKPVIDRTYQPNQIIDAFNYVESGQKTGNVIIRWN